MQTSTGASRAADGRITIFLCGDVMTGRGIDQILLHPSGRQLFEPYVSDAREYVALAEARSGPIPRRAAGAALAELSRVAPHARVINLETSVTASDEHWPNKGIHYRMHPENIASLTAARVDVCELANNHVLDYGHGGLSETVETLTRAGIKTAGAGRTVPEAQAPAIVPLAAGTRVLVFACATESSGVPAAWAARPDEPGIDVLPDLSDAAARRVIERVRHVRGPRDVVIVSIHWGNNWGYDVPDAHVRFAHWLADGGIDIVHGHSSHHPRPIEVYRGRLILYGCGDFINDYEGIEGYESYRDDLVLMYFATIAAAGAGLIRLQMTPLQIRQMALRRTSPSDARWIRSTLDRVSAPFGAHVAMEADGTLALRWATSQAK